MDFTKKLIISTLSVFFVYLFFTPTISSAMQSGNYKIERDSINFSGGNSSFGSRTLENTSGEVGTGDIEGSNYNARAGYQQYSAAIVSTSGAGSNEDATSGGRSIYTLSRINILNFTATPIGKIINLTWEYPLGSNIESVRIVRSDKFFPTNINDGEVIFEGNTNSVIDNNVLLGVNYYYTIFAKDNNRQYSSGVVSQARIPLLGEEPFIGEADPFINIPQAPDVDPIIQALTLEDFDFIQKGKKINYAGSKIVIDGKENFIVSLDYNKVPEVLKTIAMTLVDPADSSKIFTFLLRVNEDKTAYEANIGALNRSGEYKLHAIILDYENQGLKRLNGVLKAVVFDSFTDYLREKGLVLKIDNILIALAILVLAILSIVLFLKKRSLFLFIFIITFTLYTSVSYAAINK